MLIHSLKPYSPNNNAYNTNFKGKNEHFDQQNSLEIIEPSEISEPDKIFSNAVHHVAAEQRNSILANITTQSERKSHNLILDENLLSFPAGITGTDLNAQSQVEEYETEIIKRDIGEENFESHIQVCKELAELEIENLQELFSNDNVLENAISSALEAYIGYEKQILPYFNDLNSRESIVLDDCEGTYYPLTPREAVVGLVRMNIFLTEYQLNLEGFKNRLYEMLREIGARGSSIAKHHVTFEDDSDEFFCINRPENCKITEEEKMTTYAGLIINDILRQTFFPLRRII